jgi:epoxide hydrolase-like predicted phosphatase
VCPWLTITAVDDHTDASTPAHGPGLRGVITDWGGVLTNSIRDTVRVWLEADGIDKDSYAEVMRSWLQRAYAPGDPAPTSTAGPAADPGADNPIHRLERGEGDPAEFERRLAAELVRTDGGQVQPVGLLTRMFAGSLAIPEMYDLMRALRRAGIRTCLLSNSWGNNDYPTDVFPELFDAWVISAEVGMRKPEERIFLLAAERLGLPPDQCVFIDDIRANVDAAAALGMAGILHKDALATTAHLAALLNLPLTPGGTG